ncbi:sodium:calcium antiporter [uncultured Clostridium sp.]|uniref:sodium:calcium antiporter n=1 Tax=uncultured Clostridium sp. TaxID=59620 RepID=UPI0026717B3E|nr:cation transporter [uncultured Clostridium sp.]
MIYLIYLALAIAVVLLSIKASVYVDLLDKNTKLSGAFIGGVLLSAVTSLPELLTSLSSTVWLKNPGLSLGNILGSNLFNMTIIAMLIILWTSNFKKSNISKSHSYTAWVTLAIYVAVALNMLNIVNFEVVTISITSIIILVLYTLGVKTMSNDDSGTADEFKDETAVTTLLSLKQIIIRFILVSIGLVISSILITYVTDIIAARLNLGASLAGALLLGIATSLPELTSCVSLVKIGNFNVSVGNIVGSNLFNFLIIFISDVLFIGGTVYDFVESQTRNLVIFGIISTILMLTVLKIKDKVKNKYILYIPSIGVIVSYLLFMIV